MKCRMPSVSKYKGLQSFYKPMQNTQAAIRKPFHLFATRFTDGKKNEPKNFSIQSGGLRRTTRNCVGGYI